MEQVKQHLSDKQLALVSLSCQLLLIVAVATLFFYLQGEAAARSALFGGGIYWVPQCLFSVRVFAFTAKQATPDSVMADFYSGAGIKFGSTILLFTIALKFMEVLHAPLFAAYITALLMQWIVSFTLNNRY
ncbi:ATP F0F1 synthase subunit I [Oceanisphaera profunda]|uniref:ATP F0F1 synthase subunit I n=1 Tax=Oceanisphaera profunda TaxID=1416627 RepID=A0A1Y0D4Q1_9GAMM|nr:ATP synthase subunit I [Oceanisphaera profunda]ART82489.1 ATP F0F1 synthase subunit I [Oceanisphaera profunda]